VKKEDANWLALPDPPRPPTRLAQSVQRVPGLIEDEARVAEQVHLGFDDSGMADRYGTSFAAGVACISSEREFPNQNGWLASVK
jgi:hypothetical protein